MTENAVQLLAYNAAQAAIALGLTNRRNPEEAVRNLRRRGQLQGTKIGGQWHYTPAACMAFLGRCEKSRMVDGETAVARR